MKREDRAFLADRAEALAVVALTRRDDIQLSRGPKWSGYDISAELLKNGERTGSFFAVEVVPTESELTKAYIGRLLRKATVGENGTKPSDYPRMMLLADVVRDEVRYLWQSVNDTPRKNPSVEAKKLDANELGEVVNSVRKWYADRSSRKVA